MYRGAERFERSCHVITGHRWALGASSLEVSQFCPMGPYTGGVRSLGCGRFAQASHEVLYQHLSQPCIDLNWSPDGTPCCLTDAISYSLRTPGALLHTCCKVTAPHTCYSTHSLPEKSRPPVHGIPQLFRFT